MELVPDPIDMYRFDCSSTHSGHTPAEFSDTLCRDHKLRVVAEMSVLLNSYSRTGLLLQLTEMKN